MGLTGLAGLLALFVGGTWFVMGVSTMEVIGGQDVSVIRSSTAFGFADNAYRFFAGIWIMTGFGLFYCLRDFANRTALLRIIMSGLFLGGIGRFINMAQFGIVDALVGPMVLELIGPLIVIFIQSRLKT